MMKYFIALLLLVSNAAASAAAHVVSAQAGVDINTRKVVTLSGMIDPTTEERYYIQLVLTRDIPGPRVVLIDSPGGYVESGERIIQMLEAERKHGVKQICVIADQASSMAFNLLTHCDVRLAVRGGYGVVHKIAIGDIEGIRGTARNLRHLADSVEKDDEPYRQANARAMHLSLMMYDKLADGETRWTAQELKIIGYLQGIASVTQ